MRGRHRWLLAAAMLVVVAAAAAVHVVRRGRPPGATGIAPAAPRTVSDPRAPAGVRIRVEVLNATRVRGLARRATLDLRDRGFDVVLFGTAPPPLRDSTLVLDRSGHPEWARVVARALGTPHVESRLDASRDVDVTVLLGTAWRPPAEPFYP